MERRCTFCKELKDLERDFYRDKTRGHGRAAVCKLCTPVKRRKYKEIDRVRRQNRRSRNKCSSKQREKALAILGNSCVCCGEDFIDYLEIDHVVGNGKQHRTALHGTQGVYRWLISNPTTDLLQILCGNCHLYKTKYKTLCKDRHHIGISLDTTPVLPISQPQVVQ